MAHSFPIFTGNCPGNVSRDAKYSVRTRKGKTVVQLLYERDDDERWHASTEDHEPLVEMVNDVKTSVGDRPNGAFYINEYGQVIVPVGVDAVYYLAGEYEDPLRFEFYGNVLSGEGVDLDGRPLERGDVWTGPHPGIPYVLAADGKDVYYETEPMPDITRKVRLSKHVGGTDAQAFAEKIQGVKGWRGGPFYVNEWREIFAPRSSADGLSYYYVGHLELDEPWYAKPHVP